MKAETAALALLFAASSFAAPSGGRPAEKAIKEDADFGLCLPTMKYEGGLGRRSTGEFAFSPTDPLCAGGQEDEALNPNVIANRICDQLSTTCGANQAATQLCRDAQAKIQALGTKNKSTADTWNTLLGFAGALTNPSGGLSEAVDRPKDLKIRSEEITQIKRQFVECRTDVWLDNCNGWTAPEPVVKRAVVESAPKPVAKREAAPAPKPVVKREAEAAPEKKKAKRGTDLTQFTECSTETWLDDCNGWP